MNVSLLEKVQHNIALDPEFNMGTWAHCIASHVERIAAVPIDISRPIDQRVSKILEIDEDQGDRLFLHSRWPRQFTGQPTDRDLAVKRIQAFIDTDGRDMMDEVPEEEEIEVPV